MMSRNSKVAEEGNATEDGSVVTGDFDEITFDQLPVDPVYLTIQTVSSDGSFNPHASKLLTNLSGGIVKFVKDGSPDKISQYICIPDTSPMDAMALYVSGVWRKRTPKIILNVISSLRHLKTWTNEQQVENFQKGLLKATNTTEMWIITNGIDRGMSKIVGDAVNKELSRRECLNFTRCKVKNFQTKAEKLPKLTVIGIVSKEEVNYGGDLDGKHEGAINLNFNSDRQQFLREKIDLNPDHTHFLIMENSKDPLSTRMNIESRCISGIGKPRKYYNMLSDTDIHSQAAMRAESMEGNPPASSTPFVSILVQGGPDQIDHALSLLKRQLPVIVIKGSGLAADLIALAYDEYEDRADAEYENMHIKPQLLKQVNSHFAAEIKEKNLKATNVRDKILECVKLKKQQQRTFLTVYDMGRWAPDLANLDKYILKALLKSRVESVSVKKQDQLQQDLQLCLDWKCCDLAKTEIIQRHELKGRKLKISNFLFDQALMRQNRHDFVDLFLARGFQVHKYLHHKRLLHLFESSPNKEFFSEICLDGVLGQAFGLEMIENEFLQGDDCTLNHLLVKLTRLDNLVHPYELSMNCLGTYVTNIAVAERRALNSLLFWSALNFVPELTKVVWKHTDDPVATALIISMLWKRLAEKYCRDVDLKSQLIQSADHFGKLAVELLSISFRESKVQAFNLLDKKLPDFGNRTVVDIASIARNRYFIAHAACQKWLVQRWHGNINVRELDWGIVMLPEWFKIYMSVFLVFPMLIWIIFDVPPPSAKTGAEDLDDEDEDEVATEEGLILRSISMEKQQEKRRSRIPPFMNIVTLQKTQLRIPIWTKVYYMWKAPVTKFWIDQLCYMMYLCLFSLALLWPTCGNVYLNLVVFAWTSAIVVEIIRVTLIKKKKYPEVRLFWSCVEIFLIITFLTLFFTLRIMQHFVEYFDYMTSKFIMSLGHIYFYYRLVAVFFPISPSLGPMLVNIKKMVQIDLTTWIKMFLVFLISGSISILAVIYPNYPLSWEGLKMAFARGFFGLFLTKIDDLDGDPDCSGLYHNNLSLSYCSVAVHSALEKCPHSSFGGYLVVIQYLFLIKVVLFTLLYALFSVTNASVASQAMEYWKYQRYTLIVEYEEKLVFPPPFTVICYIYMLLKLIVLSIRKFCIWCCCCRSTKRAESQKKVIGIMKLRRAEDYNYWKSCVKQLVDKEKGLEEDKNRPKEQSNCLNKLIADIEKQSEYQKILNGRLLQVERNLTNCVLVMEQVKHLVEKTSPSSGGNMFSSETTYLHISSRQSPYPGTLDVHRFPVFDKYVPWEVEWSGYDPEEYTKAIEEFPEDVQRYVDPDILNLLKTWEASKKLSVSSDVLDSERQDPFEDFNPLWNSVCNQSVGEEEFEVNRTSWISKDNLPFRYRLDKNHVPQNPIGRTGIFGRGTLLRWGPNHSVYAVISRWKRKHGNSGKALDYIVIDGKKVLEFMVVNRKDDELALPGGHVFGKTSVYSVLCEEFMANILCDKNVQGSSSFTREDCINYFTQFSKSRENFTAQVLYRGYIDHTKNTDNAWREAEVWNFHYEKDNHFDEKIKNMASVWRDVSPFTQLRGNQNRIIRQAATVHESAY